MRIRLEDAGLNPTADTQSVADLVGGELRAQIGTLGKVLKPASQAR